MIEIYKNESGYANLRLYDNNARVNSTTTVTVNVTDKDTGELLIEDGATTSALDSSGKLIYQYDIPHTITSDNRTLVIEWSYTIAGVARTQTQVVDIVTPYVTISELLETYPVLAEHEHEVLRNMERTVRMVINSYCGQSFELWRDRVFTLRGSGGDVLTLPKPIVYLDSVYHGDMPLFNRYDADTALAYNTLYGYVLGDPGFVVAGDIRTDSVLLNSDDNDYNYMLSRKWSHDYYNVKADIWYAGPMFDATGTYAVAGDFGWEFVPSEINQAAKLLVYEYFCSTSYGDKWVKSIRGMDWSMEFERTGTQTTGSAIVDRLLNKFRVYGWAIV